MEHLVLHFLTLDKNKKKFMIFQLQNYLQIFAILTYFVTHSNYKRLKKSYD
ncbi:hypothetical protein FWK35_00039024 [Aphis craccivora]|uniref:Uncharacterized protein n=1 Tax=Aphis craccivora TaxID=307492 RepID=A0A6G0YSF8_APHCR|nr:hypothetical protein FWK35_00039024 [Aphis craccivora]